MRIAGRVAGVLLVVGCGGCILLVDSSPTGDVFATTCGFAHSDTACGQCIASSCQSAIDACCKDATCQQHLGALDTCAGGDCTALENDLAVALRPVGDCVMPACAAACAFTYADSTNCTTGPGPGVTCHCTIPQQGAPANTTKCGPPKGGLCCATTGWPAGTTTCSCVAPVCSTYANGCACESSPQNTSPTFYVSSCTSAHCCLRTDGSCFCSTDSCFSDEIDVGTTCTPADVTCSTPQELRVPRCSAQ